jgi:uncharacterized protein YegP (UPF0339 family)
MNVARQHKARQLRIYKAASGQWAGRLIVDNVEIATLAGFESADSVRDAVGAREQESSIAATPAERKLTEE